MADDDDEDPQIVREAITDSWRRSSAAGVDPTGGRLAPVVADERETHDRWEEHPLARRAPLIHECLSAIADAAGYLIVVSDANGMLMTIEGSAHVRLRAAGDMNFAEGTLWSEGGAGTNAIGTALALDHAVQVFGPEHFSDPVQRWTCSAAPIHDPDTGAVIGVIDLTGDLSTVHPHSLAVATATARAVEASLQLALQERDARLHARYGVRVSPGPLGAGDAVGPRDRRRPARLGRRGPARDPARRRRARRCPPACPPSPSRSPPRSRRSSCTRSSRERVTERGPAAGRLAVPRPRPRAARDSATAPIDLRPRLAEILVLLCAQPGRDERRGAVRGPARRRRQREQRARRGLAPAQAARPVDRHRPLPAHLRRRDRRAPRRGPARRRRGASRPPRPTPARCCRRSEAPGVVRERERLDAWMRQAVMTSRRPRRAVGVGPQPVRRGRSRRVEAPARAARVPRPAARPVRRPRRRAACSADVTPEWSTPLSEE